jgi:hypothetical protein
MERDFVPGSSSPDELFTGLSQFKNEVESGATNVTRRISFASDPWMISGEIEGYREDGILYYDLKNVAFINNTGMAKILELLKSLLKQGVEVRFINVKPQIKQKIKSLGLENILNCV